MEHLLFWSKCSIFHNIFKNSIFHNIFKSTQNLTLIAFQTSLPYFMHCRLLTESTAVLNQRWSIKWHTHLIPVWVILVLWHHETIVNFHRKGYLMLHHLAGATIKLAHLVNYLSWNMARTGYILAMQMQFMTLNKMTLWKVKYNIYSCFDMV